LPDRFFVWQSGAHKKTCPTPLRTQAADLAQIDDIIERLLEVRNGRPGKQVQLAENEIRVLCLTAKEIFMSQPNLLELEAPIKICGACAGRGGSLVAAEGVVVGDDSSIHTHTFFLPRVFFRSLTVPDCRPHHD
jgi:hypothetical protein